MADDAGALLVRSGLIADDQLLRARRAQASGGGTLGEHLVLENVVGDDVLTEFYRSRLFVPQVDPNDLARISPRVIACVPADMAAEFRAVPVHLDREGNLTMAMSDPSNTHAVDEIAFFTGYYVVRAVATQLQLAWCLAHYYGLLTPLGKTLLTPDQSPADGVPRPVSTSVTDRVHAMRHDVRPPTTPARSVGPDDPTPPGASGPHVVTAEEPTPPTGPARAQSPSPEEEPVQPPELEPRAGEVLVQSESQAVPADSDERLPAVVVDPEKGTETSPILLERPRAGSSQPADDDPAGPPGTGGQPEDFILLERPKGKSGRRRRVRSTRIGLGLPSVPPPSPPRTDPDEDSAPTTRRIDRPAPPSAPPPLNDSGPTSGRVDDAATPDQTHASPHAESAATPTEVDRPAAPEAIDDVDTGVVEQPSTDRFQRLSSEELDDGWGPPGTTIPPPYLGAMRGTDVDQFDTDEPRGNIPILTEDIEVTGPTATASESDLADTDKTAAPEQDAPEHHDVAEASAHLLRVVRTIDTLGSRDAVIDLLVKHIELTHGRVAFFVVRKGELRLWRRRHERPATGDVALSLEVPSTMRDVVRTRLPYRGPSRDSRTRAFIADTLGPPGDELLLVPVDVRGRVVGVVYADDRRANIFEEHLSILSRAAGMALERIIKAKKGG